MLDHTIDGRIRAALEGLPAPFRDVVEAVDLRGLSYNEAAAALDLPIGAVMSRRHRGRRRLRHALGNDHTICTAACA